MGKKGYVVTHTHWDREWRYPIWESRIYLAEMVDELLDVLDSQPNYNSFLFDGQSVFLEDYLMIRPENKGRLEKHIKGKRLLIGPWYTLPDLYPVSGESLIRNLLKGDQVCVDYGHKLNVGYESFGWGQPSQLPQIYKGFGIDLVIVAKRVNEQRAPESEFLWEGKDNTKILATRLGEDARANFYMNTYMEAMSGREYKSDEFCYEYGNTRLYHRADRVGSEQDFFMLSYKEQIHKSSLRELALRSWQAMDATTLKEDRILMDGSDSTCAQVNLLELINEINSELKDDGITLQHASIEDYATLLQEQLSEKDLRVIKGELRDGPSPSVSANALMTRYPIKKKHKEAEKLLMDVAEPFSVMGMMMGLPYNQNYLRRAMDYLLGSQSHDSINGVVQEKTVRDVMYRLDQCIELSDCVSEQVLRYIAQNISSEGCEKEDILILLANPLPMRRNEIIEVTVDCPAEQNVWDFEVLDLDGKVLESAHLSRKEVVTPTVNRHTRPEPFYADRHKMIIETGEVPAGGYKILKLNAKNKFDRKQKFWPQTRMSNGKELGTSANTMENEYIQVIVQPSGTIKILDKSNGVVSGELNYLESNGDIGDYWIYYPPYEEKTFSSLGTSADIWMEENTPLQTSICVAYNFMVPSYALRPESGIQGDSKRVEELVAVPVKIKYVLKKGVKKVEVFMTVENRAKDHRLTVNFDTGIIVDEASAGGHFCVETRSVKAAGETNGLRYTELDKLPMQGFVDVSNGQQGFGIVSQEFLEYDAAIPGRLSCTLFRAVRNIICTEFRSGSEYPSQGGGQLQEKLEYHYAIVPHQGTWESSGLVNDSQLLGCPLRPIQYSTGGAIDGGLPQTASFFEVGNVQVSCVKQSETQNSLIVRFYNVMPTEQEAFIRFAKPIKEAFWVDLKEEREKSSSFADNQIEFAIGANKIATVEVIF